MTTTAAGTPDEAAYSMRGPGEHWGCTRAAWGSPGPRQLVPHPPPARILALLALLACPTRRPRSGQNLIRRLLCCVARSWRCSAGGKWPRRAGRMCYQRRARSTRSPASFAGLSPRPSAAAASHNHPETRQAHGRSQNPYHEIMSAVPFGYAESGYGLGTGGQCVGRPAHPQLRGSDLC